MPPQLGDRRGSSDLRLIQQVVRGDRTTRTWITGRTASFGCLSTGARSRFLGRAFRHSRPGRSRQPCVDSGSVSAQSHRFRPRRVGARSPATCAGFRASDRVSWPSSSSSRVLLAGFVHIAATRASDRGRSAAKYYLLVRIATSVRFARERRELQQPQRLDESTGGGDEQCGDLRYGRWREADLRARAPWRRYRGRGRARRRCLASSGRGPRASWAGASLRVPPSSR